MNAQAHHEWMNVDVVPTSFKAHLVELIETNLERKGSGTEADPVRRVTQYWSLDGRLLLEIDPCAKEES